MLILSSAAVVLVDPDATAWVNAVIAAGGTVSGPRRTLVDTLVLGLKSDGVWAKLDRLWIFAAENTQSALIDFIALEQAVPTAAPTFTVDRGYAGNGTSSYIKTLYDAAGGVNWSAALAHIAAWDNTSRAKALTVISGVSDGDHVSDLIPFYGAGIVAHINSNVGDMTGLTSITSQGFFIGQRNTGLETEYFYNGESSGTTIDPGSFIIDLPLYICARNDNGSPSSFTSDQVSMVSYGGSFVYTEATAYFNRLRTYMTAVGVP